ncbi:unnamed protein product [Dimorphilus gyrociliatus]|uniref:Amine oxidase n=1 Tax=Dimorphilus gyrociliatus TaxID=2664684 RepID=A0A7I8W9I0_9ANNE|nr:unnamed protein product [Dimorphilus gyrociliatus]
MSIIIIGAGLSGLAAATELLEINPNADVKILEASSEIGGRIKTIKIYDKLIELGAQWIHGNTKENSAYAIAQAICNTSNSSYRECSFYESNGKRIKEAISNKCCELFYRIQNELEAIENSTASPNMSVAEYFDKELPKYYKDFKDDELLEAKNVFKQLLRMNESYMGALLTDVSINDPYISTGDNTCVNDGLAKICYHFQDRIYKANRTKDIIKLNHKVEKIVLKNSTVKVVCSNGLELNADHVLVTLPLGVLKQSNHLFDPPLPKMKQHSINRIGFGFVGKFSLYYENPVWKDSKHFAFIPSDDPKDWTDAIQGYFKDSFGQNILTGWIVGPYTLQYENVTDEELMKVSTNLLRKYLNDDSIPLPQHVFRYNFCSSELFKGCYSYVSMETQAVDYANYSDPILDDKSVPRILFAGEATIPQSYSTMHGAVDSGKREARRIIDYQSRKIPIYTI